MWRRAAKIVGSTTALCAGLSVVKAATKPAPPLMTYSEPDPSQFELVQVQVIMRHGARSTCALLDTETPESFARDWKQCHDPEQQLEDAELRSCVPGQLTVNGEHMCVELGKRLASRYRDTLGFLPNTYDPSSMHVESTTYQRARLSLKRMLEGLFPNGGAPSQEHLDNQIDPDNILVTRLRGCNALLTDYRSAYREAVMEIEDNPVFSNLRARIKEGGGADPMDTKSWVAVGDWAHSRTFHGIPLRDDLPEDFLPTVERAAWHEFRGMLAATAQSLRLGLGPFVDRIVAQTDYAASRHKPPGAEVRTNVDLYAADREAWERETGSGKSQDVAIAGLGTPGQSTKGPQLKALNEDPFSPHPNFSVLSENPPKLVVYSGHDTSLTPLAAILGVPLRSWPPFSSHFELELWRHKAHDPAQEMYAYNKLESIVSHKKPGKELTHKDKFPPGREWPHVRSDAPAPAPVSDQYWVRAIFNGDVVRVMPLGHFKETMSYFGTGGIDRRRVECGEFDPYIGNWIWDNAPANTIEGKMDAEKAKGKK